MKTSASVVDIFFLEPNSTGEKIVVINTNGNLFMNDFRKPWTRLPDRNRSIVVWIFSVTLFEDWANMSLFKITGKFTFIQKCVYEKERGSAVTLMESFRVRAGILDAPKKSFALTLVSISSSNVFLLRSDVVRVLRSCSRVTLQSSFGQL